MNTAQPSRPFFGLLQRRTCVVPTWRGWLVLFAAIGLLGVLIVRNIYPFLALNDPIPGHVLVVEGWAADYTMRRAVTEFNSHPYTYCFVTGSPLDIGAPLSRYHTYAELGAATLLAFGMPTNAVITVPTPAVPKDRTYFSACALRAALRTRGITTPSINIISVGPHTRRTHFLFARAFGSATRVGIISIDPPDYNPARWWTTSAGFRTVTGEALAYFYARLLFRPAND